MSLRTYSAAPLTLLVFLSFGTACTEDPLTSTPASGGPGTNGSPTSFDPPATTTPTTGAPDPTTTGPASTGTSSTGEPGTTASTTIPDGTVCGDGIVAGPEECDLGDANANTGACTLECKHATCGDGLVWADGEQCDFGLGNSDAYGGCREDCQWGSHCGDGVPDGDHETCDRGELNGSGITTDEYAPCDSKCGFFGRIMFITSQAWDGDHGGVSGGDLRCRVLALEADLANATSFRAWLSDDVSSPATRFTQWDQGDAPLILIGGRVIADDFDELIALGPRTGIARTELGDPIFNKVVWTNTTAFGEVFSTTHHCAGWTSASDQLTARAGLNALSVEDGPDWQSWRDERWWTSYDGHKCHKTAHLYCIDDGIVDQGHG